MDMQFRDITYIPIKANSLKEAETVTPSHPENVILFVQKQAGLKSLRKLDFGRFCFTRKDTWHDSKYNPQSGVKEHRVDPASFRPERVAFVGKTISYLRELNCSEQTIVDAASKLTRFYLYLEQTLNNELWPGNQYTALACYQLYTEYLTHLSRLPRNSEMSISSTTAAASAKAVRELIANVYDLSQREIERTVPSLRFGNSYKDDPPPTSQRQAFVYVCLSIFEQFHAAIREEKPFPWSIDLSNAGIPHSFFWFGRTNNPNIYGSLYFNKDGVVKTRQELLETFDAMGVYLSGDIVKVDGKGNSTRANLISRHRQMRNTLEELNNDPRQYQGRLQRSYEIATYCFWYVFLAATGLNYSVASNLKADSGEYIPQRGYVFSGLKVRAGNKIVHAEFKKRFEKYFLVFKDLRTWAVSQLIQEPPLWFFLFDDKPTENSTTNNSNKPNLRIIHLDSYKALLSGKSVELKNFIKQHSIPIEMLSPTELRKGVAFDFYKLSGGEHALVAQKLGNTIKTVQGAYSGVNEEDSYPELAEYYTRVIESLKPRGLSAEGSVPIKIIEDGGTDNLPVGHCENHNFETPEKAKQFSEYAPAPDCARSETCLFCTHFAMHADEVGIRKLLSFRELFPLIKKRKESFDRYVEIFAPIEARIEEIIEHIKSVFPEKHQLLDKVTNEIAEGVLDHFWDRHFNFLTELGEVE